MFSLLYNETPHLLRNFRDLRFVECTSVRFFSSTIHNLKQLQETSFTVSYLINSCGLLPEDANSASKIVQFVTPERPDSVLSLLKRYGFSTMQITKIVKSRPSILLADPEKNIGNKLEFFSSIGISGPNLAEFICSKPLILSRSLNKRIIPVYKFLKSVLPSDDSMLIKAVSNASRVYLQDVTTISANLSVLREVGMPQSVIQLLVLHGFGLLCLKVDTFRHKIDEAISMGFLPTETKIIHALAAKISFSESQWQHKTEVYRRCGWSNDEVMLAFRKFPYCMTISEEKIIGAMDFLVHVMDLKPSAIAASPYFFSYSLKKRTVPRGLIVKILTSNGLLEKNISFSRMLQKDDELFFKEYVEKHREQVPYLTDVFEGRMSPRDLGFQYGQK